MKESLISSGDKIVHCKVQIELFYDQTLHETEDNDSRTSRSIFDWSKSSAFLVYLDDIKWFPSWRKNTVS